MTVAAETIGGHGFSAGFVPGEDYSTTSTLMIEAP